MPTSGLLPLPPKFLLGHFEMWGDSRVLTELQNLTTQLLHTPGPVPAPSASSHIPLVLGASLSWEPVWDRSWEPPSLSFLSFLSFCLGSCCLPCPACPAPPAAAWPLGTPHPQPEGLQEQLEPPHFSIIGASRKEGGYLEVTESTLGPAGEKEGRERVLVGSGLWSSARERGASAPSAGFSW